MQNQATEEGQLRWCFVCILIVANKEYYTSWTYCFPSSASLSIGSPVGRGVSLSTLYFNVSEKSIPTMTFLSAATISDIAKNSKNYKK